MFLNMLFILKFHPFLSRFLPSSYNFSLRHLLVLSPLASLCLSLSLFSSLSLYHPPSLLHHQPSPCRRADAHSHIALKSLFYASLNTNIQTPAFTENSREVPVHRGTPRPAGETPEQTVFHSFNGVMVGVCWGWVACSPWESLSPSDMCQVQMSCTLAIEKQIWTAFRDRDPLHRASAPWPFVWLSGRFPCPLPRPPLHLGKGVMALVGMEGLAACSQHGNLRKHFIGELHWMCWGFSWWHYDGAKTCQQVRQFYSMTDTHGTVKQDLTYSAQRETRQRDSREDYTCHSCTFNNIRTLLKERC